MALFPATEQALIAAGYDLDPREASCGSCGRLVRWCKTPAGKKMPLSKIEALPFLTLFSPVAGSGHADPEKPTLYQSHFADCPNAAAHRKAR